MATPWKDPRSGTYYLYRKIPVALREEMAGKAFVRRSLDTKDPKEAARKFVAANAAFEEDLDRARAATEARLTRDEISSERAAAVMDEFLRYGLEPAWERWPSLARLFWLEDLASRHYGASPPGAAPLAEEARSHDFGRLRGERLVGDTWLETIRSISRAQWMTCCRMVLDFVFAGTEPAIPRTPGNEAALMDAFNGRVAADNARLHEDIGAACPHIPTSRLKPNMRLSELLETWVAERRPSPQTEHETRKSITDLIDLYGDVAIGTITRDMVLDYRDKAKGLPSTMRKAEHALPFTTRVGKHSGTVGPRVSAATLKKRIGGVQALLGLAHGEGWLANNVSSRIPITGYTRSLKSRRSFRDGELNALFRHRIFLEPGTWFDGGTDVSDLTLAWLFLLGATSGARIEEVGQSLLMDVQVDAGVPLIDIDDRIIDSSKGIDSGDAEKSVKNEGSRRVMPIHPRILSLGFMRYVDALRELGQPTLFPDLIGNSFGKRSKEASRRANRLIDGAVSPDRRLVFHSLRHKFKDEGRSIGIADTVLDQMTGYSPPTVGARYGDGAPVRVLARQLSRLKFNMIDWGPLIAAFEAVDWKFVVARLAAHAAQLRTGA